jgi:predicted Zn-dependent peptidase
MSPLSWASSSGSGRSASTSIQPYVDNVRKRITEFKLENGLKFIVLEQHRAPIVSFLTHVNVGGANEPDGQTGVAHYLEHLAFKGTTRIGTRNYQAEKPWLETLDRLFDQLQAAKAQNQTQTIKRLQVEFEQAQSQAMQYVKQNEIGQLVKRAGGVGLNATTSVDATRYFYSFPANKLELWMSLESERFLDPVFREFYQEKEVILEERRTRTEDSPLGQMAEALLQAAYQKHPYRRPVIGYSRDIQALTRQNVQDFFNTYYVPSNLTIAIVGDVNPSQVKKLAQTYFGRYPTKPAPPDLTMIEPPQTQAQEVILKLPSQPWYLEVYHRPALNHPDQVVYELISRLLSSGRTARLYKSLVETQRIAMSASSDESFPGNKYPSLMLLSAQTAPGHTVEEVATALHTELDRLKTEPVSLNDLDRVKTRSRAGLLRNLDSNMGMASVLLEYEVKTGSWRNLFKELEQIEAVTPTDIQRVAKATFTIQNRTVGKILTSLTEIPNQEGFLKSIE